jgi:flagellar motor switch protein FliN/FliY
MGSDAEELLNRVEAGLNAALAADSASGNVVGNLDGATPFELSSFDDVGSAASTERFSLGTLDDVELELQIELGRAELLIEEVLSLREGAVVPLDKLAGDPVDILVNGRLLARGEVLVLNDNFCVRVAEIVSPDF